MAKRDDYVDPASGPLNMVRVGDDRLTWAVAFPRNYDVIFDHARPLVPDYRLED